MFAESENNNFDEEFLRELTRRTEDNAKISVRNNIVRSVTK